jgi:DNA-binding FrmR family transcriptional regulator
MEHRHGVETVNRLARIEGHVRGIKKMVEEGRSCDEVLLQIGAVKAALDRVGRLILREHLETCVLQGVEEGRGDEVIARLNAALDKFL